MYTSDSYMDLGNYHKEVSTKSSLAQKWVDRGISHLWGFTHVEAIRCFKLAIEADPTCAFAYYGVSYAYGPHYNLMKLPKGDFDKAIEFMLLAIKHCDNAFEWEKDLIYALKTRYADNMCDIEGEELTNKLRDFCNSMKIVYEKYPTDNDIAALYVEAIMNLRPWQLWTKNGEPHPEALIAKEVLEKGLKIEYHPQLAHLYIHLLELSPYYKDALEVSNIMNEKTVGISHLLHMPSHIFIQLGDYKRSIESNLRAIEADHKTFKYVGEDNFYSFYRCHNIQFVVWSAMFIGDFDVAYKNSLLINDVLHEGMIKKHGDQMEFFRDSFIHVLIRFGKWDQILELPLEISEYFPLYRATIRYARSVAYAVKGDTDKSEIELNKFREERLKVPDGYRICNNTPNDVYNVAEQMALGELLYRKGEYEAAFNHLRKSVENCDNLIYSEPWDWMQPPRHALAALLLEQGKFEESEEVYLKDLSFYPNNVWSLVGLEEIYTKRKEESKLKAIELALKEAKENAKFDIKVSCFCKKK